MPSVSESISFWHMALAQPLGIWLRSPDPVRLKSMLYAARAKAQDPTIAHLQIHTSPSDPHHELWIVNPNPQGAPNND